jgi:hypothetical protein
MRAMTDVLVVPQASFDIEEPWVAPAVCVPVRLRLSTDGSTPRQSTSVAVWYDRTHLSLLFSGMDDAIIATHMNHDDPLYEEDVVELFIAPDGLETYYELEVSPRGTIFDARVESPDGDRRTMHVDRAWTCEGLMAPVRLVIESDGTATFDILMRIPHAALGRGTPQNGEEWRANFFRVDRHPTLGCDYSAWQPTLRNPADFHVPASFGVLRFHS